MNTRVNNEAARSFFKRKILSAHVFLHLLCHTETITVAEEVCSVNGFVRVDYSLSSNCLMFFWASKEMSSSLNTENYAQSSSS